MITEKQKEELKSLTEKVETYCNEKVSVSLWWLP